MVVFRSERIWSSLTVAITYGTIVFLPLLMVIIDLASIKYAYGRIGNFYCIPFDDPYLWGTYLWFFCFGILASGISIGLVIWKSFTVGRADPTWALKSNLRVFLFLCIGVLWMSAHIVHSVWIKSTASDYFNDEVAWITCTIFKVDPPQSCPVLNSLNTGFNIFLLIMIYSPTFTLPLFFGSNIELWTNWNARISPLTGFTNATSTTATATATATASATDKTDGGSTNFMSDLQ